MTNFLGHMMIWLRHCTSLALFPGWVTLGSNSHDQISEFQAVLDFDPSWIHLERPQNSMVEYCTHVSL